LLLSAYLASHILFQDRYYIIDRLGIGGFGYNGGGKLDRSMR